MNQRTPLEQHRQLLSERLSRDLPRHKVNSMVALLSKLFCKAQLEHTDFSLETLAGVLLPADDDKMPLGCSIALTDVPFLLGLSFFYLAR